MRDAGEEASPTGRITLVRAVEITGLSVSSIQRRVDAWLAGEEPTRTGERAERYAAKAAEDRATGYALKGGRSGRNRTVDEVDAYRLRAQLDGGGIIPSGSWVRRPRPGHRGPS